MKGLKAEDRSAPSLDAYRRELRDLYLPQTHRAGKNSFWVRAETSCGLPLETPAGGRKTLLAVQGCGSLRQIHSTWGSTGFDPARVPYRLDDASLRGIRLTQRGEGPGTELAYSGLTAGAIGSRNSSAAESAIRREVLKLRGDGVARLPPMGPCIVRRFRASAVQKDVRLRIP